MNAINALVHSKYTVSSKSSSHVLFHCFDFPSLLSINWVYWISTEKKHTHTQTHSNFNARWTVFQISVRKSIDWISTTNWLFTLRWCDSTASHKYKKKALVRTKSVKTFSSSLVGLHRQYYISIVIFAVGNVNNKTIICQKGRAYAEKKAFAPVWVRTSRWPCDKLLCLKKLNANKLCRPSPEIPFIIYTHKLYI